MWFILQFLNNDLGKFTSYILSETIVSTTTKTTHNTYENRNFLHFSLLNFNMYYNGICRCNILIPGNAFRAGTTAELTFVDSSNKQRWLNIKYISGTSFQIYSSEANISCSIDGIFPYDLFNISNY